jgi:hypothetical protein
MARSSSSSSSSSRRRGTYLQLVQGHVGVPLARQVHGLAPGEADGADGLAQAADDLDHALGRDARLEARLGAVLERRGEERVARKDGQVLAVQHVVGRLAAPQVLRGWGGVRAGGVGAVVAT